MATYIIYISRFYYRKYMQKTLLKYKKTLSILMLSIILIMSFGGNVAYADIDTINGSLDRDGEANYTIDTIPDAEVEDEEVSGFLSKVPFMGWTDDIPKMSELLPIILNYLVDILF